MVLDACVEIARRAPSFFVGEAAKGMPDQMTAGEIDRFLRVNPNHAPRCDYGFSFSFSLILLQLLTVMAVS